MAQRKEPDIRLGRQYRGRLMSVDSDEALVKLATPAEGLIINRSIMLGHILPAPVPMAFPDLNHPEVFMRHSDGEFYCIGEVTEYRINTQYLDMTSLEGTIRYIPTMKDHTIQFRGLMR